MATQVIFPSRKRESFEFKVVDIRRKINPYGIITKLEAEEYLTSLGLRVEIPEAGVSRIDLFKLVQSELLTIRNHGVVAPIRMNSTPIPGKLDMSRVKY